MSQEKLWQKRTAPGQLFLSPRAGERVEETPPVFSFIQEKGSQPYRVEVRSETGEPVLNMLTRRCFVRPPKALDAGRYSWRLSCGEAATDWISFEIAETAVTFVTPNVKDVWESIPSCRPRHLFFAEDKNAICREHETELQTLRRNVEVALQQEMPQPPRFHVDDKAIAYHEYFVQHREYVDRDLVACSLAWALLEDEQARDHGVNLLMTLCSWDSAGPCALDGPKGDEIGLSHARCLPAVLDLLWDALTAAQRSLVVRRIVEYGKQCQNRLEKIDFFQNPGNSHAGRLPAYLGEIACCLKGCDEAPQELLQAWLQYALEVYSGVFPFFGCTDGGWAEGVFYATSYTKWYLPFFAAVYRYAGVNFLDRPFYQRYASFLEHFVVPNQENYPFGDGYWCTVDSDEFPGFFAQNPYRVYAERTGSHILRRFEREAAAPELFEMHLLDVFLPRLPAPEVCLPMASSRAALFSEAGFLSLHTNPERPDADLVLLGRGSKFGSVSHQHADQGSFCLKYGGVTLISPSGYYGRCYGTPHHRQWTNTSQAHNTLLIGGQGQATWSYEATGQVLCAEDHGAYLTGAVDGSHAYDGVKHWRRTFTLTEKGLRVEDDLVLRKAQPVTWCLHMLSRPKIMENGLSLTHRGIKLGIVPREGLNGLPAVTSQFATPVNEGVPPGTEVERPDQYHVQWQAQTAKEHRFVVEFALED